MMYTFRLVVLLQPTNDLTMEKTIDHSVFFLREKNFFFGHVARRPMNQPISSLTNDESSYERRFVMELRLDLTIYTRLYNTNIE